VGATIGARREWLALATLCAGFFMLLLDSTITSVALPEIAAELGMSASAVLWVNSGYLLAYSVPLLVAGRVGDRYGHRRLFVGGLLVFVLGSLLCAIAPTATWLVVWRGLQGLGAALMTPQCLAIIRTHFQPPRLALALGLWGSIGGVAAAAGPLLGGLLVQTWDWRAIFAVNLPIGVLTLGAALLFLPASSRVAVPLAPWAIVLNAAGGAAFVLGVHGLDESAADVWGLPRVVWAVGGIALVVAVVFLQRRRGDAALLPVRLLRERSFVVASTGAAASAFAVGSAAVPVMLAVQTERGLSVGAASVLLVPMGVVCIVGAPLAARGNNRRGLRFVGLIGATSLVVSIAATALLLVIGAPLWTVAVSFAAFGIANSFVWSPLSISAVSTVPVSLLGAASGAFNAIKQGGAVVGSAATALVLSFGSSTAALAMLAGVSLIAVAAAAGLSADRGGDSTRVLSGEVVHGAGRGRGLSYPTANLRLDAASALPADGVYAGWFRERSWPAERPALVSVGTNETFTDGERRVEVHVLDFDGDLYGRHAAVRVEQRLRSQRRYPDPGALIEAMRGDERAIRARLAPGGEHARGTGE
jgi:EmrB/QacA subfamily drug resistance transporter